MRNIMNNLLNYIILNNTNFLVYYDRKQEAYYIMDDDWTKYMEKAGAFDENGYVLAYIYQYYASILSKEIYKKTHSNKLLMILENNMVRKLHYNEKHKCYYDTDDNMII